MIMRVTIPDMTFSFSPYYFIILLGNREYGASVRARPKPPAGYGDVTNGRNYAQK
jgi:hypothetical protein